ncbi:MAG: ribosomal-processing cysteine protease Prp [Clostridia bacterium]|nr:ribosomal-processing cysteine protease Prp [Clostridia bacterium]
MITAVFSVRNGALCGFHVSGHSGYAPQGKDIVCSAVSSAVIFTANLMEQYDPSLLAVTEDGMFAVYSNHQSTPSLLKGLKKHLVNIQKQYPQYIRVYNLILNGGNTNV